jgi:hypothetical protein
LSFLVHRVQVDGAVLLHNGAGCAYGACPVYFIVP